jgi:putative FmdB family regulatory protein
MILFDFQCTKCKHLTEIYYESGTVTCPKCGSRMKKVFISVPLRIYHKNDRPWGTSFWRSAPKKSK